MVWLTDHGDTLVIGIIGKLIGKIVRLVEQHALVTVLILGLLTVAAGVYSSLFARIDSDLGKLIKPSADTRWYQDNERYKQAFPDAQQTAVIVVSGDDYHDVEQVTQALADDLLDSGGFEFVRTPGLDTFLAEHRLYFLNIDDLESWLQGVQFNYGTLLRLSEDQSLSNIVMILADQLSAYPGMALPPVLDTLLHSLLAGDPELASYPRLIPPVTPESRLEKTGDHLQLIILKGRQNLSQSLPNEAIVRRIREGIAKLSLAPGPGSDVDSIVNVRLTGEVALAHEEISAGLDGVGLAGVASLILLAVILGVGVRSWQIIVTTFLLLLVGVVLTSAYATLVVGSYNTLSLVFLVMFFGLGIDFAIHFSLKVRDEWMFVGHHGAVERAAVDIGPALLLCTFTSAIGFLSFVPTAYNGLGELGVISAGGMVIAFLLSITLLPAMFSLFGGLGDKAGLRLHVSVDRLKPGIILLLFLILMTVSAILVKDMKFDYSVLALRDESSEGMQTLLELQRRKIVTDYSVVVVADDLSASLALKEDLEKLSPVGDVFSISDIVPPHQLDKQAMLQDVLLVIETIVLEEPNEEPLALDVAIEYFNETINASKFPNVPVVDQFIRYAANLETVDVKRGLQAGGEIGLREQITEELEDLKALLSAKPFKETDLPSVLRKNLVTESGGYLIRVQPGIMLDNRAATDSFITEVQRVAPNVAGRSVVEWGVGNVVVDSFIEAVIYSFFAIFSLLVVYFRGLILPALVIFPLTLTVLFTFALAQLVGLTLNMANILVVPLIFGLGVDTGVHVIHRFRMSRNLSDALASSTSRAVVISGLTTIGTFASLSLSPHKGAASIGVLLSLAITILLVTTFVALPAMLAVLPEALRRRMTSRPQ